MTGDLKPCPFCGGNALNDRVLRSGYEAWQDDPDAYSYFVRCIACAAEGGWAKSPTSAVRLWNTRIEGVEVKGDRIKELIAKLYQWSLHTNGRLNRTSDRICSLEARIRALEEQSRFLQEVERREQWAKERK